MNRALCIAALCFAACDNQPQTSSISQEVNTLQCPAGQVAWNFSRFPRTGSSEWLSQSPDASVTLASQAEPVNLMSISYGSCDGYDELTPAVMDACEGRTECVFSTRACAGKVSIKFACADGNGGGVQSCLKGTNCYFDLACPQPTPTKPPGSDVSACVPSQCHGATRRDGNLACVIDDSHAIEYRQINARTDGTYNSGLLGHSPRVTVAAFREQAFQEERSPISLSRGGGPVYLGSERLPQQVRDRLAGITGMGKLGVIYPDIPYRMRQSVQYVVPTGEANTGMHGALVFWLFDEVADAADTSKVKSLFRCRVTTADMRKYGVGAAISQLPGAYAIALDERFVLPRDCADFGTILESKKFEARKRGLTLIDYLSKTKTLRTRLAASYDLEGRVTLYDDESLASKQSTCAPNPVDFFYDVSGKGHDQFAFYDQRRVVLRSLYSALEPQDDSLADYYVLEPSRATTGVTDVRPKALQFKVKTVGAARGFLRADVDWFLAGDRDRFWQGVIFPNATSERYYAFVETSLMPLDANDEPTPEPSGFGYEVIGRTRVIKATSTGRTINAKFPITEDLRAKFLDATSPIAVPESGRRKFRMRSCLRFGTRETAISGVLVQAPYHVVSDGCVRSAVFEVRVDHSVAPLEPLGDAFAESQPQAAGDGRMAQSFDDDSERVCVDGDCKTQIANGVEGTGMFGGTVLKTEVSATNHLDGGTATGASVSKDIELLGFSVMDEEEDEPVTGPDTKLSFKITPPWDEIIKTMKTTWPGARFRSEKTVGVNGMGIGYGYKTPVRYGPVQGDFIISITAGFGAEGALEYTFKPETPVGCAAGDENCLQLYQPQPSAGLTGALKRCYDAGGRLAGLMTDAETRRVRERLTGTTGLWLGAQVANEYVNNQCMSVWRNADCSQGHQSHLRWLSDDEDFATSTSFQGFSFDPLFVGFDGTTPAVGSIFASKPANSGVVLMSDGSLAVKTFDQQYSSVCVMTNTASAQTHELKFQIELSFGAGISMAFCTPSEEAGVCLEGSVSIIGAKLTPSIAYVHHDLKDKAGRTGTQSNFHFSLDYEVKLLAAEINATVKFGPWFSFSYNLFSFSGIDLPSGSGNIVEHDVPLKEDFQ